MRAPRVHHAARRRGSGVAARGARAAAGDAGDRVSQQPTARRGPEPSAGVSPGPERSRFVEGENLTIEYRLAENHAELLPALAADLVRRQVVAIAAMGTVWSAAKAATTTIPIVFPSATTRSGSVLSPASPVRAAT